MSIANSGSVGNGKSFGQSPVWVEDPVFMDKDDNKWYFLDETRFRLGPYSSEKEARYMLEIYCDGIGL
jgi:hypothetical protein